MANENIEGQLSLFSAGDLVEDEPTSRSRPPVKDEAEAEAPGDAQGTPRKHYVCFDLETKNTFDEVGGRANMHKLEVSVGVAYDSRSDSYLTYREDELPEMVALMEKAEVVTGYNIVGFDYPVLQKYTEVDLYSLPTFDIMLGIEHSLGYRIGLDKVAAATLGVGKSGHGLQAIEWYRNGQWDLLIKYCRQDVKVTKEVYEFGLENQHVFIPAAGSRRQIDIRFDG